MAEKFILIRGKRVRKDAIRKYEPRSSNEGAIGVTVFLDDGEVIVDWDQTVEDIDKQMETE